MFKKVKNVHDGDYNPGTVPDGDEQALQALTLAGVSCSTVIYDAEKTLESFTAIISKDQEDSWKHRGNNYANLTDSVPLS